MPEQHGVAVLLFGGIEEMLTAEDGMPVQKQDPLSVPVHYVLLGRGGEGIAVSADGNKPAVQDPRKVRRVLGMVAEMIQRVDAFEPRKKHADVFNGTVRVRYDCNFRH